MQWYLVRIHRHFNPLPPHGGRPIGNACFLCCIPFQSTPSAWRETDFNFEHCANVNISIHSLRMEGDTIVYVQKKINKLFQSTPSAWRETSNRTTIRETSNTFQSTPSAWRETVFPFVRRNCEHISIHSLRMEGDPILLYTSWVARYFNPLPPHGGRPVPEKCNFFAVNFNPLPPHGGRHVPRRQHQLLQLISIHSLRMEGDSEI